jgi:hypothetical protein
MTTMFADPGAPERFQKLPPEEQRRLYERFVAATPQKGGRGGA